ncbi:MAG TPA: hypothetical protein VEG34_04430 [Thermoanaerobaculia bacterium]|nr:hypothetical protein [Thermoanaerobaculia bacterium]
MERAVQLFALVQLTVIGLSHLILPRPWAEFFLLLRSKGTAGAFFNGFLSLGFGSVIVAFHQVWSGPALALTLLGCAQVLKALLIFAVPGYGVRGLARVSLERAWEFRVAGVVLLLFAGLCGYLLAAG